MMNENGPIVASPRRDYWEYRGVIIFPKNVHGMYSARVDVPGGGQSLSADTLAGIKTLIRDCT